MKVHVISNNQSIEGTASSFNTHSLDEVVVYTESDCLSVPMSELEVIVGSEWKPMQKAFKDRDIIPNNYNTCFDTPHSDEEKHQGFNW